MEPADCYRYARYDGNQAIQRTQKAQPGKGIHHAQAHGHNQVEKHKIPVLAPSGTAGKKRKFEFENVEKVGFEGIGGGHGVLGLLKSIKIISDQYTIKKINTKISGGFVKGLLISEAVILKDKLIWL